MELLRHLLDADPAGPRLTVYTETTGARLDFSALTLDNWAAKVANMLREELDLEPGSRVSVDLPVGWQSAAVVLGCLAAGVDWTLDRTAAASPADVEVVFAAPERAEDHRGPDLVLVTDDPFGRGVVETGGTLPAGAVDFGPTVRFYADEFGEPTPSLADLAEDSPVPAGARVLATGWTDDASFTRQVLEPLAVGGSSVVVAGFAEAARLDEIAAAEKVTHRL